MNDVIEELSRSPSWLPHALDLQNDALSFVRLSQTDYYRASFLDDRILTPLTETRTIAWPNVSESVAAAGIAQRCGFIFHIGHVGSTLLSRLLGAHRAVFSLREPQLLRGFSHLRSAPQVLRPPWSGDGWQMRVDDTLKLLSRTFEAQQIPIIKATSFVSEQAAGLLSRPAAPRALLMSVCAESYLATILGGPNSRKEAALLLPSRLRRLNARIGRDVWRVGDLSEGERVAVGWACEMTALAHAARVAGDRVLRMDFDEFLRDPANLLAAALRHFHIDAATAQVEAILRGPDMRRYSKAQEHAYDAALRLSVLQEARAVHRGEIRRGLLWLDSAAATYAPFRGLMTPSAG